jgi:hypothetical protein
LEKIKIVKLAAMGILFLFLFASAAQASYGLNIIKKINEIIKNPNAAEKSDGDLSVILSGKDDYEIWEDLFDDASKIDPSPPGQGKSENYVVANGEVSMSNTYEIWTDPSWTKLRPITVTNSGGALSNCLLKLEIDKDNDMQSDYDDIRFKHENDPDNWLSYWIEDDTEDPVTVWVKILSLPSGGSTLYLFYGNPGASGVSDITIFESWQKHWSSDEKITNHLSYEGAWDPDVAYGYYGGEHRFLIGWEEGAITPIQQEIRGKIYTNDGSHGDEFGIEEGSGLRFHHENPSIAFDGNNFLVVWQNRLPIGISGWDPWDIKGKFVEPYGGTYDMFIICEETSHQRDPQITFNTDDNEYLVVWEDYRDENDFDIYAKRYTADTGGNQAGPEIQICVDSDEDQFEPWAAYDDINNQYMVVFEESLDGNNGPFSLYFVIIDADGIEVKSKTLVVSGSSVDNIFPCVAFCSETQQYLITWNEANMPNDWWGNIKGKIYDDEGNVAKDKFTIDSGEFIRTDIVPYGEDLFFVAYNDQGTNSNIWGTLITSDGTILTPSAIQLSDSDTDPADWVNLAVDNEGKIFAVWEDARDNGADKPDAYGNMWWLIIAGSDVIYSVGDEKDQILNSYVTSIEIIPTDLNIWHIFDATYYDGTITFDILDGSSGIIILGGVTPGTNLHTAGVTASTIRLMAKFTRANPSTTPKLDEWSVQWDPNDAPYEPSNPDPYDGETDVDVDHDLSWDGGDPDPGDTVTYDIYFDTVDPPTTKIVDDWSSTTYDQGTMDYGTTYYWQIVAEDSHGATTTGPVWDFTTHNDPPYTPSNPDPYDGETDVDVDHDLSWDGGDPNSGDTVAYDVYFEADDSTPDELVSEGQSGTTYDPGTMDPNTDYYWQIVAEDNHGATTTGPIWLFTTENNPPYTPSDPDPEDGETGVDVTAVLSWSGGDPDPGDTVTYDVYFEEDDPTPDELVSEGQSGTTYDPPGNLAYGTTYYWQIVAEDNHGATTTGPIWHFTTAVNAQPYTPTNPDPYDGETDVDVDHDLYWDGGDPNPGDTVTYDVYFDTVDPPQNYETIGPYPASQTNISYDPGTMMGLTTYYWKIVAWDNHGAQAVGSVWEFTTEYVPNNPPYTPYDPDPANHETDVDVNADFSWSGGDPDPYDTVTYDVYFGISSPPSKVVSNQSATTYDPGTMTYGTKYYWKIIAWDNNGAWAASPIWDFTTHNDPPYTPTNPDPYDGETDVDVDHDLYWDGGDPNPGDTVTYDVYFGTSSPPPQVAGDHPSTTYESGTMDYHTQYYWKIVAEDNHGETSSGPEWTFTTENRDPDQPSNPDPWDGETDVDVDHDLSWTCSDPDEDTLVYDIYFDDFAPPTTKRENDWPYTTWDPGTMQGETTFYWKIVAQDDYGGSTEGDVWQFTTEYVENDPPDEPDNPNPYDGETDVSIDTDLSCDVSDPDGDSMDVEFYLDGVYVDTDYNVPDGGTASIDLPQLDYETTYDWYAIADDGEHQTPSDTWSFITEQDSGNDPPDAPDITGPLIVIAGQDYDFTFQAFDINADQIKYVVDWLEGDPEEESQLVDGTYPGTPVTMNHTFNPEGFPIWPGQIKVKTVDEHGAASGWTTFSFIKITEYQSQQSTPLIFNHLVIRYQAVRNMIIQSRSNT